MKQETAVATTTLEPETATSSNNFRPAPERKRSRGLSEDKRFKIFAGSANLQLAEEICKQIGVSLGETKIQRFADGEIYFQLLENVRGVDVFIVQPTCNPVDSNLVELLIMIDALKRASAGRITAVVPYYGQAPAAADVPKIKAPLLLHYAGLDDRINAGIPAFEKALKDNGKQYELHVYEGVNHAFNNDTNAARYNKDAAELAWSRTLDFLRKNLGSA